MPSKDEEFSKRQERTATFSVDETCQETTTATTQYLLETDENLEVHPITPGNKLELFNCGKEEKQTLRFKLRSLSEQAHLHVNEPYDLYKGDAKIDQGVTDEHGNILVKDHKKGTKAYTAKLVHSLITLDVKDALNEASTHIDQLSKIGKRVLNKKA